ncbi:hypothetical protein Droror1_Dr00019580 [Drosera rotundifolia]
MDIGIKIVEWIPPRMDQIKINFDGGYSPEFDRAVRSGIFRRSDGSVLFAFAEIMPPHTTSYYGEVMALRRCIEIALVMKLMRGCDKIWIEGDAKFLVETVNGVRFDDRYDMGGVTIIQAVGALFESCDITFVHREANEAADELCHVARRELKNCYWYGEANLPKKVVEIIERERKGCAYVRCYKTCPPRFRRKAAATAPLLVGSWQSVSSI